MRNEILDILKSNPGAYVSGEMICKALHVSRSAVWKHVRILKEQGYDIEPVRNKGYRLNINPGLLNRIELETTIPSDIGYVFLESVDSTNDHAKKIAGGLEDEFFVVAASSQSKGKGRMGRRFHSDNELGGWISVVMKPPRMTPEEGSLMTAAAGVAVCRALERAGGIRAQIKWPNDIILNNKKVCGILCEMSSDMDKVHYIIAGIGINILQEPHDFQEEIRETATSLYMETKTRYTRPEIIGGICRTMHEVYEGLKTGMKYDILKESRAYSLTLGERILIRRGDETEEGLAVGIDDRGRLMVRLDDNRMKTYHSGEISITGVMGHRAKGEL
ncbi:MAG: biotin--[acetyl-CoA-carboxylase] ligase [Clostridia bacterium]